jgi:hypothetical protein
MSAAHRLPLIAAILLATLALAASVSAAGISAYAGDTIPLSGYSPSSPWVYLFLTGPNLPTNGVALNDITKLADEGGFTKVETDGSDGHWSYNWHTGSVNGRLDDGVYTVWVANGPNDRSNLQEAEYGTISVILGKPTISASTSGGLPAGTQSESQTGSLTVRSVPENASVTVNSQYRGMTPLTIDNLDFGTYAVIVTKFGYVPYSVTAPVQGGAETVIEATLPAETGTLSVNTTPADATVIIDGRQAGTAPVTLTDIPTGSHNLTATLTGYATATQSVTVAAGTNTPVTVVLSPASVVPAFTMKAPGLVPVTLLALCAAAVLLCGYRLRRE